MARRLYMQGHAHNLTLSRKSRAQSQWVSPRRQPPKACQKGPSHVWDVVQSVDSVYVAEAPGAVGLVSITNDAPLEEATTRQLVRARLGQLCNKRNPAPNSQTRTPQGQPSLAVLFSVQEALIP